MVYLFLFNSDSNLEFYSSVFSTIRFFMQILWKTGVFLNKIQISKRFQVNIKLINNEKAVYDPTSLLIDLSNKVGWLQHKSHYMNTSILTLSATWGMGGTLDVNLVIDCNLDSYCVQCNIFSVFRNYFAYFSSIIHHFFRQPMNRFVVMLQTHNIGWGID